MHPRIAPFSQPEALRHALSSAGFITSMFGFRFSVHTGEWISRQLTEAFGWEEGPCYLVRDRDGVYGEVFTRRV